MTLKMPDRIRWNIKHLAVNLEVGQFLEDLLEGDVLDEDQYDTVVEKESDKLESAKCVVRFLLKKTSEQIDKFLSIVEQYQPDVASHVAETMRKRREGVGAVGTAGGGAMGSVQSKSVAEKRGKPSRLSSTASTSSGNSRQTPLTPETGQASTVSALPLPSSELPKPDDNFVGRDGLVRMVSDKALQPAAKKSKSVQVQSLVGPPGFGKTSIAVAVGHTCQTAGMKVVFINLRGVQDINTVHSLVSARLREVKKSTASASPVKSKVESEPAKPESKKSGTLVILDNAEDCMTSNADSNVQLQDVIKSLISPSRPRIHVLLTSRVHFEVHAVEFKLEQHNVGCLDSVKAIALLQSVCDEHSMTSQQASVIVEHCGYVPLAIRIAAGLLWSYSVQELVQLFKEIGLNVFKDDNLKPDHRILRLLEVALCRLPQEDKDMFYALSQFPTSFSSAAACAIVNFGDEAPSVVHLHHFDRLVKICFLEYNRFGDRYSMQPFISEFGRHECPGSQCDMYRHRFSLFYLDRLSALSEGVPFGVELGVQRSRELMVDFTNIGHAYMFSGLLSSSEMSKHVPYASGGLCRTVTASSSHVFLENMLECSSLLSAEENVKVLLNLCWSYQSSQLWNKVSQCKDVLRKAAVSIEEVNPSNLALHLDIAMWEVALSVYANLMEDATRLSATCTEALTRLHHIATQILEASFLVPEQLAVCGQMTKFLCRQFLGGARCSISDLEKICSFVVGKRYLSSSGATDSNRCMFLFLELVLGGTICHFHDSREVEAGAGITAELLHTLAPLFCSSKRVPCPIPRGGSDAATCVIISIQSYLAYGSGGMTLTSPPMFVNLSVFGLLTYGSSGTWNGFQFMQNLMTPKSAVHSVVSNYMMHFAMDGSANWSDGEVPLAATGLDISDKSGVMNCFLTSRNLLHRQACFKGSVNHSKRLPVCEALESLTAEYLELLPANAAHGLSVSGVVYLPVTITDRSTLDLLEVLHHQSKRVGGVDVDAHLELLQWWPVAPACFVCYTLDNVEKCPRCQMAWLCTKHRVSQYQDEHSKHCDMLLVLAHRKPFLQ